MKISCFLLLNLCLVNCYSLIIDILPKPNQYRDVISSQFKTNYSQNHPYISVNKSIYNLDSSQRNLLFYTNVSVGTPSQTFKMVLDTGSSDVWVTGNINNTKCHHRQFLPNVSSSFQWTNLTFQDIYGTGSVKGQWGYDTIGLKDNLVLASPFGIISEVDSFMCNISVDGILGLGLDSLTSSPNNLTWFSQLHSQDNSSKAYFTFNISLNDDIVSKFTIGEYLPEYKDKNYNIHHILSETGYWSLPISHLSINDKATKVVNNYCDPYCPAIVDSGTSLITVPETVYLSIMEEIIREPSGCHYSDSYQRYVCNNPDECRALPKLAISIPDQEGKLVNYNLSHQDYTTNLPGKGCAILLDKSPNNYPIWILGLTFLNRYYTVFHQQNQQILLYDKYSHTLDPDNVKKYTNFNKFVLTLMILAFIIVTGIFIFTIYKYYKYRKGMSSSQTNNNIHIGNRNIDAELLYSEL